jgi:hypothetical protein
VKGDPFTSPVKTKKLPACFACKKRKVKCEYKDDSGSCVNCAKTAVTCGPSNRVYIKPESKIQTLISPREVPPYPLANTGSAHMHGESSTSLAYNPMDYPVSVASIAAAAAPPGIFIPPGPKAWVTPSVDGDDKDGDKKQNQNQNEEDEEEDEDENEGDGDEAMSDAAKAVLQEAITSLAGESDADIDDEVAERWAARTGRMCHCYHMRKY